MKTYIISYDLKKERNYDELYEKIKSYSNWAHINESLWAIVSSKKASDIRDELKVVIDGDDSIFVIKSGTEAAWSNVLCKNDWLKDNL